METPENSDLDDDSLVFTAGSESFGTERLSTQERLRLAKKRRAEQLRRWAAREREYGRDFIQRISQPAAGSRRSNGQRRNITFEPSIMLLEAAARNDLEEVRRLLETGVSPDSTNEDGLTALHQCCIDDSEEMMKLLISYGGNPNATDTEKWTPLHAAATCGHLHLVKFLIDAGAELLSVNADGNMPYDLCEDDTTLSYIENEMAMRGVTQELIDETRGETERRMLSDLMQIAKSGGDLEFRDHNGASPLHIASANGYLTVVEFLLDNHVSTDAVDDDLWQPIHAAACWGHLEVVELLAQNGADVNALTRNGETPFDICEDPEIKERLVELKEQRLLLERPRVRRSRSTSTRTQSIRRTSLREKMNTTKRDVQDEKLYFIQSFDSKQEAASTTVQPPSTSLNNNSSNSSDDVVDIKDVQLTLLPTHLPQANNASNDSAKSAKEENHQAPPPPTRPPRLQNQDAEVVRGSPARQGDKSSPSSTTVTSPPATSSSVSSQYQSMLASQTLSDLKKQRSMSRAVHQQQHQKEDGHHEPQQQQQQQQRRKSSPEKQSRHNNNRRESGGGSNHRHHRDDRQSGPMAANAQPSADSGPASIDVLKFSSPSNEVVGPPKKTSCCKIM